MNEAHQIVHLKFDLDVEDNWPPVAVEAIPCHQMDEGYRILDAPLYIKNLSVGDVVQIDKGSIDQIIKWSHVTRSDHSTIWLLQTGSCDQIESILAQIREISCSTVSLPRFSSYAIDVPGNVAIETVEAILEKLDDEAVAIAYPSLRHPTS